LADPILREIYETVVGWGCTRDGRNKKYVLDFGIVTSWTDIRWLMKLKDLARCIKTDTREIERWRRDTVQSV
jgi:hypothetical protein